MLHNTELQQPYIMNILKINALEKPLQKIQMPRTKITSNLYENYCYTTTLWTNDKGITSI